MTKTFHVVFVGIALPKFSRIMGFVRAQRGYRFSYIVTEASDIETLLANGVAAEDIHHLDERAAIGAPTPEEIRDLASLETGDVPTIHNMIRSDSVLTKLPYADGIAYAAHLARGLRALYRRLQPSVIIGGHDRMHSSMGVAIARAEGIRWFAFSFSTVPMSHIALSPAMIPAETIRLRERSMDELRTRASTLLEEFERGRLKAPAYVSAHSLWLVLRRLRPHFGEGLRALLAQLGMSGRTFSKYNLPSVSSRVRRYVRKRKNMIRLPTHWFVRTPPDQPFIFFGLHMQPESTPDVLAPFFSNQLDVVEKIARAMPPTHKFLVKLHISDADNYSRAQLKAFLELPGVRLVLPTVSSRDFIDRSAAVVTICGTMGLEAALLGKPVIIFGKMNYELFPSVRRVLDIYDLPALVREQISLPPPSRDEIVEAYARYLSTYESAMTPGAKVQLDDWSHTEPSHEEQQGFLRVFVDLEAYLAAGGTSLPGTLIGPKS